MKARFKRFGRSLARVAGELLDFRGRARIVDVVYLYLILAVASLLARAPLDALSWDSRWYARSAVDIVVFVPWLAFFSRRLHDQGLSGWWSLLLLPGLALNLHQSYRAVFAVINHEWLFQPDPFDGWKLLLIPVGLAVVVLILRPGTRGPNRYGADPREGRELVPT